MAEEVKNTPVVSSHFVLTHFLRRSMSATASATMRRSTITRRCICPKFLYSVCCGG